MAFKLVSMHSCIRTYSSVRDDGALWVVLQSQEQLVRTQIRGREQCDPDVQALTPQKEVPHRAVGWQHSAHVVSDAVTDQVHGQCILAQDLQH